MLARQNAAPNLSDLRAAAVTSEPGGRGWPGVGFYYDSFSCEVVEKMFVRSDFGALLIVLA
jgi:hypothetical protein